MATSTGTTGTPPPSGSPALPLLGEDDGVVAVALADEAFAAGPGDLRWHLAPLITGGTHTVEIDVSHIDRLSSGSIATLLWVKRTCAARQIRVVLISPTTRTLDQLRRTGLANVLEIGSQAS
jgi:ABC-type transporter Mla MlaB component